MTMRTPAAALALLALVGLSGAGTGTASAASAASAAGDKNTTVKAVETDFHIALSKKTFSPGRYTFVTVNKGQTIHSLEITGPGLKHATTANINPGKSATLKVTLKKGRYDIFCPVPGHKALGMNMNVVVGSAAH